EYTPGIGVFASLAEDIARFVCHVSVRAAHATLKSLAFCARPRSCQVLERLELPDNCVRRRPRSISRHADSPRVAPRCAHIDITRISALEAVMRSRMLLGAVGAVLLWASSAFAQSAASNKAFFAKDTDGITFAPVNGAGYSAPITLISVPAALKTSNGGAMAATPSMESLLATFNLTPAIVNGGKSSSSSRASIKAWVEIDGLPMEPGEVVFNDRLQATGLTVNLTCAVPNTTCTVSGDVTLELFQATKSAQ